MSASRPRKTAALPPTNGLSYVSLFSGAGVGCHGFHLAGFNCAATVEKIERRLQIQRFNRKCRRASGYICGDLQDGDVRARVGEELRRNGLDKGELDILIATPPCQGMSVCNHKKRNERARNSLVVSAVEMTESIRPKIFIFENVRRFLEVPCADSDGQTRPIGEALRRVLSPHYEIFARVVNLKNYGCASSRTRALVVGTRKDLAFTPLDIWPGWTPEKTLRQVIGNLPALKEMGEISPRDIFHAFREYDPRMREWLRGLREGESAFDNKDKRKTPHRVVNGKAVPNKRGNGDKYRRQRWDAVAPCVHTRNDIMASQNTVHPADDRVFSVREVMRMMSVPQGFKWGENSLAALNKMPAHAKRDFLKANEMNIRQCLGEAVPAGVFRRIADNARAALTTIPLSPREVREIVEARGLDDPRKLRRFVDENPAGLGLDALMTVAERANTRRLENAAYYTPAKTCFKLAEALPPLSGEKVRILEPAAGVGRLLVHLSPALSRCNKAEIEAMDIDGDALALARVFLKKAKLPRHVKVKFIQRDFLQTAAEMDYDLIIGNPPFGPMRGGALAECRKWAANKRTRNIFSFFAEKSLMKAAHVVLITPKSLLNAPEFAPTRELLRPRITGVCDYGETGFKGVKIETVAFAACGGEKSAGANVLVESVPLNRRGEMRRDYIFDAAFPVWLIYRDEEFDRVAGRLELGRFQVFRDRQITKRDANGRDGIRVLKSRNIGDGRAILTDDDMFIHADLPVAVKRFIGDKGAVLVPNLSYSPRACRMPDNCVADGSVAILSPKDGADGVPDSSLSYFASDEFRRFYRVARNHGTRSLNIDPCSVHFFGVRRHD